jgi:hypothetical protein
MNRAMGAQHLYRIRQGVNWFAQIYFEAKPPGFI